MEHNDSWRKSSYSGAAGSTGCLEAAHEPGRILIRDTTNRVGYTLPVPTQAWRQFITRVKQGHRSQ
jgi:hypothetical protein